MHERAIVVNSIAKCVPVIDVSDLPTNTISIFICVSLFAFCIILHPFMPVCRHKWIGPAILAKASTRVMII